MAIPKMPVWVWMRVSFVIAMFALSVCISSYLWHAGARTIAGAPLMLYAGAMTLYSMWKRFHSHSR
jgi:hypothetical protein